MAQSMHALYAYGRAFDTALIAAAVAAAGLSALVGVCSWMVQGCERWRQRRAERRYVRAGMRELERYLSRPPRTRGPHGR